MDRFLFTHLPPLRCKESMFFLACAWVTGLIAGAAFPLSASAYFIDLMPSAIFSQASLASLLLVLALPVLFSAFAVYISLPLLLIPAAFIKAFLFSSLSSGVFAAFGSAGWLVCLLFLFSDILMLPVLWFFWLKAMSCSRHIAIHSIIPFLTAALIIGCVEYRFISPFLASILS